jgi:hypothetical protein
MQAIKDLPPGRSPRRRPDRGGGKVGSARPKGTLLWAAIGVTGLPVAVVLSIVVWLLHGNGVI